MSAYSTATENAIYDWVVTATGLAADRVIWSDEQGKRPSRPYVSISLDAVQPTGQDWQRLEENDDPDPGPYEHLIQTVEGERVGVLTLQAFSADGTGTAQAAAILARFQTRTGLDAVTDALWAAKVGVLSMGPVRRAGGPSMKVFEPRAILEVRLALTDSDTELIPEITSVTITDALTGVEINVPPES